MSFDAYDDLDLAEGLIGTLGQALHKIGEFSASHPWSGLGDAPAELRAEIASAIEQADNYCRITCNHVDEDEDCGCPCHEDET